MQDMVGDEPAAVPAMRIGIAGVGDFTLPSVGARRSARVQPLVDKAIKSGRVDVEDLMEKFVTRFDAGQHEEVIEDFLRLEQREDETVVEFRGRFDRLVRVLEPYGHTY